MGELGQQLQYYITSPLMWGLPYIIKHILYSSSTFRRGRLRNEPVVGGRVWRVVVEDAEGSDGYFAKLYVPLLSVRSLVVVQILAA